MDQRAARIERRSALDVHIGARLRALRESVGMSLDELARHLAVAPSAAGRLERGELYGCEPT